MPNFKDIEFNFENFAGVNSCNFSLASLTVLSGPNSAGKTYVVYAIYSFLKEIGDLLALQVGPKIMRSLEEDGVTSINLNSYYESLVEVSRVSRIFHRMLPRWFSVSPEFFKDSKVVVSMPAVDFNGAEFSRQVLVRRETYLDFSKVADSPECLVALSGERERASLALVQRAITNALTDIVLSEFKADPFAITSERTGISLFWKELDINKNQIIDKLIESKGRKFDPWELIEDQTSRYALPITDNIDVARDADNVAKQVSFIGEDDDLIKYVREPFEKMALGRYRYNKDGISFEHGRGKKKVVLPIYVTSSSIKSLFLLDLFIGHIAKRGSLLVFDEPELNLHPANQRLMAQVICRLISCGINVLMTTHSDFLLREINNRVALGSVEADVSSFLEDVDINPRELINGDEVLGLLLCKDRTLSKISTGRFGLDMRSIDEAIVGATSLQGLIIDFLSSQEEGDEESH